MRNGKIRHYFNEIYALRAKGFSFMSYVISVHGIPRETSEK
jgi:hypothetical protein